MKKLSIITINYNNRDGLRKTIESVVNQTWQDFEYIIIDGGSKDGSVEVIKEFADHIDYWVSEPDKGIYNAMNKGVKAAKGEYCQFLNSGDMLSSNTSLGEASHDIAISDIVIGGTRFNDTQNICEITEKVTMKFLYARSIPHPSSFIRRKLLEQYPYDEQLRIVSDWKFWVQSIIYGNATYKVIPNIIVDFDVTGISAKHKDLAAKERERVLYEFLPERILIDYYQNFYGNSYSNTDYDKLFVEIRKRNYRKPIYGMVAGLLRFVALFVPSARFVRNYPRKLKENGSI